MSQPRVLDTRTLNRTLLLRQGLLERGERSASEWLEHLVGMQAQEPADPYVAMWTRTQDYDPSELAELMRSRRAVRATLMRGTIHMVTAADYLRMRRTLDPMIRRRFMTGSSFAKSLGDADFDEIAAAGRDLIAEAPRTRAELSRLLAVRWPRRDATALGHAAIYLQPSVQVTPRGVWGETKRPTWALAEQWIGSELARRPDPQDLIRRYLRAFGPASIQDIASWSGMAGVRKLVEPLRDDLRIFRTDDGVELLDIPDAPIADPDLAAPVRFLPVYDNVTLGHADRTRVIPDFERPSLFAGMTGSLGGLLVDGFFRGLWKREDEGDRAVLRVEVTKPLSKRHAAAVSAEGGRLLGFLAGADRERDVRIRFPEGR